MKWLVGIAGLFVVGIYIASVLMHSGAVAATDSMMWIVGAAAVGAMAGVLLQ